MANEHNIAQDLAMMGADDLVKEIERLHRRVLFYQSRCDLLQSWQRFMREPERTLVCDVLANGTVLPDKNGGRYPPRSGGE